ncbi:hypothetical protein PINS_up019930 [Pythium insidiosum]|nr:hypothetical protein PINS_up019930 [Pythium insidiosum]
MRLSGRRCISRPCTSLHWQAASAAAAAAHAATSFRRPLTSSTSAASSPRLRPVVQPIHIGPPTEYDFRNTNGLMKCLNSIAPQPSPEELSAKHLVISELQRIVDQWLRQTEFPERRHSEDPETRPTATMLLGGSWHLKVGLSDSDLDVVALMPRYVSSELFFESLNAYLRGLPSVRQLRGDDQGRRPDSLIPAPRRPCGSAVRTLHAGRRPQAPVDAQ